jgi:CRISPR-associated protein Cst1
MDVGIAAVCAMVGKQGPGEVTSEDLDEAAKEMEEYYFSGLMTSYLTCVFMNSEYVQPGSGPKKEESRRRYARRVLYGERGEADAGAEGQVCVFSGEPATHLIHRGQMPLLTGEDVLNFYPGGGGALPIAAPDLRALQALPLGGRRTEGKLLIAHADDGAVTVELARLYVDDNRRLLGLAKAGALPLREGPDESLRREQGAWDTVKKRPKYPDAKSAQSLITADLIDVWDQKRLSLEDARSVSITVYWLSSSGQGPSLEVFPLPSNLVQFLALAGRTETRTAWRRLVGLGWQRPGKEAKGEAEEGEGKKKKRAKTEGVRGGPGRSRNAVLADLLAIYEAGFCDLGAGRRFLRRHLLSELRGRIERAQDCDWSLVSLFLQEVFGMERERVEAIRNFADRLAEHIRRRNDKGLFRSVVYAKAAWEFRNALTKAQRNEAQGNSQLLFGLDEYLAVFEAEGNVGRLEWSLTRDLISIRLVEQLYKLGFLSKDLLGEEEVEEAAAAER